MLDIVGPAKWIIARPVVGMKEETWQFVILVRLLRIIITVLIWIEQPVGNVEKIALNAMTGITVDFVKRDIIIILLSHCTI